MFTTHRSFFFQYHIGMDLNTFFSDIPVYIINLKDSLDRKQNIRKEFEGFTNLHFIEAIDGRTETFKEQYDINLNTHTNFSNPLKAVVCSHIKAIKQAYDNDLEYVCIFEDDVHTDLIKSCNFTLNDICNLNSIWDAIQLFYTSDQIEILNETYNDFKINGLRLLERTNKCSGTCYIINRKAMSKFLNNIIEYSSDLKKIIFKVNTIDPEDAILGHINSFIVNRQICYYYSDNGTFNHYTNNMSDNSKSFCRNIHLQTKNILQDFYR